MIRWTRHTQVERFSDLPDVIGSMVDVHIAWVEEKQCAYKYDFKREVWSPFDETFIPDDCVVFSVELLGSKGTNESQV